MQWNTQRLRDARYTRILIATLPEPTPVEEALFLENDLKRAGIGPFAWIINQSLSLTETQDPLLLARRENERPYIERVREISSGHVALVPWMNEVPAGAKKLQQLVHEPPRLRTPYFASIKGNQANRKEEC